MIVIDTNVLSEVIKPAPSSQVLRWMASQPPLGIYTTAVTQAEILYGVELLPAGKRRTQMFDAIDKIFTEEFKDRILPFDDGSAKAFAVIAASRNAAGRPVSQFDAMIAGISRSHQASLATRNTNDFELCGIKVINPWFE